jgi:phosphoribosyl 1,2-cyclic phosphate phosphodiesterase
MPGRELKMKIVFLGTGTSTGVPVVACDCAICKSKDPRDKRLRTSLLIYVEDKCYVIDCGPDFRYQMIRANVEDIHGILLTHQHRDHISGLDDVRGFNYVLNKPVDVFAAEDVIKAIYTEYPYILNEARFFGAPQLIFHRIDEQPFMIDSYEFIPISVLHNQLKVFGFRIADFTYITDASYISENEKDKMRGSKIIVLNALRNSKHVSHFSLQEAVDILNDLKPEKAYITHMSHFIGLHEDVEKKLPPNFHLAYDTLEVEL